MTLALAIAPTPRLGLVVRASAGEKKHRGFGGDFKKRLDIGKKKLDAFSEKLAGAHKKNIEKLDEIAKDDVEFIKEALKKRDEDDETVFVDFVDVEIADEE